MKVDNNRQNRKLFVFAIIIITSLVISSLLLLNHIQSVFDYIESQTKQIEYVVSQLENANILLCNI